MKNPKTLKNLYISKKETLFKVHNPIITKNKLIIKNTFKFFKFFTYFNFFYFLNFIFFKKLKINSYSISPIKKTQAYVRFKHIQHNTSYVLFFKNNTDHTYQKNVNPLIFTKNTYLRANSLDLLYFNLSNYLIYLNIK